MSTNDPYQQYRAAFGAELRRVAPKARARRRRRSVLALGGATVGLAAAGSAAVILAPTTGTKLDVLAEAKAAVATTPGSILHFAVTGDSDFPTSRLDQRRAKGCKTDPLEVWQTTDTAAPRYRLRLPLNPCGLNTIGARIATGPLDIVYGDRTSSQYSEADGFLETVTDLPAKANAAALEQIQSFINPLGGGSQIAGPDNADPVTGIRLLLAKGKLSDGGQVRGQDGRELRRLTGFYTEERGDPKNPRTSRVDVEYLVDAKTYAPVKLSTTSEQNVPKDIEARRWWLGPQKKEPITYSVSFASYEKLPLNADTEKLITVQPKPGTDITSKTYAETSAPGYKYPKPDKAEKARAKAITDQQIADGIRKRTSYTGPNGE